MKKYKDYIEYIIIILAVVLIRTFFVAFIRVNGESMSETLDNGNIMLLKKYEKNSIDRFDIVVFKYKDEKLIKRVIGLPEEDIEYQNSVLYVDGREMQEDFGYGITSDFRDYCGEGEYFVLGDNRTNSIDSRRIGCVEKSQIMGTTDFIFFPFSEFGKVE